MTSPDRPRDPAADAWLDFYQLLQVAPDSDSETLRKRIREAYSEAIANSDHRIIERRIHFQTMSERVIPQCRRILLDPDLRARYDHQRALHQNGDPGAQGYDAFLAGINVAPDKIFGDGEIPEQEPMLSSSGSSSDSPAPFPEEIFPDFEAVADAHRETPSVASEPQSHSAEFPTAPLTTPVMDAPPAQTPLAQTPPVDNTPPNPEPAQVSDAVAPPPVAPSPVAHSPVAPSEIQSETPQVTSESAPSAEATEAAEEPSALFASVLRADGPQVEAHSSANLNLEESATTAGARRRRNQDATRISLGDDELSRRAVGGQSGRGKRVLSHTTQMLAMGIVAALLTIYIMRSSLENAAARVPLRIACASDLQPFLELAQKQFEATEAGNAISVELRPVDSRAAMGAILSGALPADIWIPAESLWSDRFNQVAGGKKIRPISLARSIALSPAVLIARSDRSASLRKRFPGGVISSWSALREAVARDAPSHFGLTDPTYSGAGAIARYFMAREWCRANRVPWDKNAARNPRLGQWLSGFENNVPASARLSADMVKELALGTADRYWWAIGYESEAVSWLQKGKNLDVFYLPQTTYADHPLCAIEREGEKQNGARSVFEAFLRSDAMQKALLQTGLRPTEIEITSAVPGNPFTDANYRARGLKQSGFPTDSRINYAILNALNAAWSTRSG